MSKQDKILPEIFPKKQLLSGVYVSSIINMVKAQPAKFGITPSQIASGTFGITLPTAITPLPKTPPVMIVRR